MKEISIPIGNESIKGDLTLIPGSHGLVIFAHGSGSSRLSTRNRYVANVLNKGNLSTLLFDLLTESEEKIDQYTREYRFDIPMLAQRLVYVTSWVAEHKETAQFNIGYFGSSTGAAAALMAAAQTPNIKAVISRGGRPDLAMDHLPQVKAATLFIVGGLDYEVIELNEAAYAQLNCTKEMKIIPGATHLFEEPGTLEQVAEIAKNWLFNCLR